MATKATAKSTKSTAKPAAKKAAGAKRPMPSNARVASASNVVTLGSFLIGELKTRNIEGASNITIKRVDGGTVNVNSLTQGIALEPITNFNPNSVSIRQEGKAA